MSKTRVLPKKRPQTNWTHWRMILVCCCFSLAFCAVVSRVYYLQTVNQAELQSRATPVERSIKFKPRRGQILDRHGTQMAITVKAPSIAAHPKMLKNPIAVANQLAPILGLSPETVAQRLNPKRSFVWLKRQTRPDVAQAIRELKLKGILVLDEHKRFYPQGTVGGQLMGFVGIDGDGLEGLERTLDKKLAGHALKLKVKRDARGSVMLTEQTPDFERFEGHSVELTIDERIQRVAQKALQEQVDKYSAKGGYAVVMDVKTGEVLAMANTPSFDPNRFRDFSSKDWRLRNITDTFEPGSVVKPLVLAAALDEKKVKLRSVFDCEKGRIKIGRYTIRDSHAHDTLTAAEVVQVSSNICAYKMAQLMGRESFYGHLKNFGFGSRTGIGLRNEQPGLVWHPKRWAEVSFANMAFGQGFTSTPLQVTSAIAALANDGMLMKPRMIRRIIDRDGQVVQDFTPQLVRRVVSAKSARQAAWAMSLVTTPNGTAPKAALEHFTVAGKTGTAQKVNPKTKRYDHRMWVASFVGFFPAERPEVVIAVMVDEPQKMHYGGVVAAPAFVKIAKTVIRVRDMMPVPRKDRFKLDEFSGAKPGKKAKREPTISNQALLKLRAKDDTVSLGTERIVAQPAKEETEQGVVLPNLHGLTMRQAFVHLQKMGLTPKFKGWGRVVAQHPEAGQRPVAGQPVIIELSPVSQHRAAQPASGPPTQ